MTPQEMTQDQARHLLLTALRTRPAVRAEVLSRLGWPADAMVEPEPNNTTWEADATGLDRASDLFQRFRSGVGVIFGLHVKVLGPHSRLDAAMAEAYRARARSRAAARSYDKGGTMLFGAAHLLARAAAVHGAFDALASPEDLGL